MQPSLHLHLDTAATLAGVLITYRFAVSPAVRSLSRRSVPLVVLAVIAPTILLAVRPLPDAGPLRWTLVFVLALLTWQGATSDYDVTDPIRPQRRDKLLLLALAAAACLWPPTLLAWLAVYCGRLRGWRHHAMMPLRILKAYLAWWLVAAIFQPPGAGPALVLLLGCVALSHYVKPAWSKARLGPRPWSWAWHNRTHYLIAAAYCWGWARFLPAATVSRLLRRVQHLDRPVNVLTVAVETAGLVAFADRRLLIAVLAAAVLFNVAVALASGILFWENIGTNAALAMTIGLLPDTAYAPAFGWLAALIALVVLLLSAADLLWQPWHLGWWDAPFTARVHWQVETVSGRQFGLYNDFMCPYEREYGRILGYFLTLEPVLHGHLGVVWDRRLRDRLVQAGADQDRIRALKETYGHPQTDDKQATEHIAFLTTMFSQLNGGTRKSPLPRSLHCLKAPGGQLYYWGDLPAYRGDEPVNSITIRYQERTYRPASGDFVTLTDHVVRKIDLCPPTATDWST